MKRTHQQIGSALSPEPRPVTEITNERDAVRAKLEALDKELNAHPEIEALGLSRRRAALEAAIPVALHGRILDREWPDLGILEELVGRRVLDDNNVTGPRWEDEVIIKFSRLQQKAHFYGNARNGLKCVRSRVRDAPTATQLWEKTLRDNKGDPLRALAACCLAWLEAEAGHHLRLSDEHFFLPREEVRMFVI